MKLRHRESQAITVMSAVLGTVLPLFTGDTSPTELLQQYSNLTSNFLLSKKSRNPTMHGEVSEYVRQWTCQTVLHWRNLGSGHYPQFIKEYRCTTGQCWYGHFSCVPQHYMVKVLSNRLEYLDDTVLLVPGQNQWRLVNVRVSVGCMCKAR